MNKSEYFVIIWTQNLMSFYSILAATADFFGNKILGTNYGWMFTAYGIAGIACFIGAAMMATTHPPKLKN